MSKLALGLHYADGWEAFNWMLTSDWLGTIIINKGALYIYVKQMNIPYVGPVIS